MGRSPVQFAARAAAFTISQESTLEPSRVSGMNAEVGTRLDGLDVLDETDLQDAKRHDLPLPAKGDLVGGLGERVGTSRAACRASAPEALRAAMKNERTKR